MKVLNNKLVMLLLVLVVIGAFVYLSGVISANSKGKVDLDNESCSGTESYCALHQQAVNVEKEAWNPASYTRVRNSIGDYKKQNLITAEEASRLQDLLALKYYNSLSESARAYCVQAASLDDGKISTYLTELQLLPSKVNTGTTRTLLENLRMAFRLPPEVRQYVQTGTFSEGRTGFLLSQAGNLQTAGYLKENKALVHALAASKNWLNAFADIRFRVNRALNDDEIDLSTRDDDALRKMCTVEANGSSYVNASLYRELTRRRAGQQQPSNPGLSTDSTQKNEK